MKIKIFLLASGQSIISSVDDFDSEDFYVLFNPYVITGDQNETQNPLIPYWDSQSEEGIKLYKRSIMAECNPSEVVKNSYSEKFESASA